MFRNRKSKTGNPAPPFVEVMKFAKSWRPYQQRVLDNLEKYLDDQHFHLVSAPGSGKTVTGLEVMRRIGKPALVLVPTLAIREQWIDRLMTDYLGEPSEEPDWLSRELSSPAALTISTYQSLSSEFRKEGGMEKVVHGLGKAGIMTLVVDEAHHLRANWWKCLTSIKDVIPEPVVVALTATPPIDVPAAEWNRYASFCGPVDVEVGVPELIAEKNLCPHQDFVLFSVPSGEDVADLERFQTGIQKFITDLQIDVELAESIGINSPIQWIGEDEEPDFLKTHQSFFLALAIFLQSTGGYIPPAIRKYFEIDGKELPTRLNIDWAEALLNGLLFLFREKIETTESLDAKVAVHLKRLEEQLRDLGAIERGRVVFKGNEENEKLLRDSTSKLDSIAQIVEHEIHSQGGLMRAVILTDYIRKEAFPNPGEFEQPLVKLGVVPIFEMLRRIQLEMLVPAALTGSLVVIPRSVKEALTEVAIENGMKAASISTKPLPHDSNFLEVDVSDSDRQKLVGAMTDLFERGDINCLIGTAALLGEGWDAPALNTLILASVIGSFVMSNQMRGRAIRTNPIVENKISNIWHIAAISPKVDRYDTTYEPGPDFDKLKRRFSAFHGVGFDLEESGYTRVESGWDRLGIFDSMTPAKAEIHNRRMFKAAENREVTEFTWKRAIAPILDGRYLRAVSLLTTPRRVVASKFIVKLNQKKEGGMLHNFGGWLEKRRIQRVGRAIYVSLAELDLIEGKYRKNSVQIGITPKSFHISAPHLSPGDQAKFITAMDDFFDIFQSPRYLVVQKDQYYSVPKILAGTKHSANRFSSNLKEFGFGRHELHYAYSDEGRPLLLEARKKQLLNHFDLKTETKISWQPV